MLELGCAMIFAGFLLMLFGIYLDQTGSSTGEPILVNSISLSMVGVILLILLRN